MSRVILALILALGSSAVAADLKVGDTQKDAIAELGRPTSVKTTAKGALMKFKDGTSVRLENGVVAEITSPGGKNSADVPEPEPVAAPAPVAPPTPLPSAATKQARAATDPRTAPAPATSTPAAPRANAAAPASTNRAAPPPPFQNTAPTSKTGATGKMGTSATAAPAKPKATAKNFFGMFLLGVGLLVLAAGNIMMLIQAFKAGTGWGLGCLFVPIVQLIFIISHWEDTKKILALQLLGGLPILILGAVLMR